MKEKSLIKNAGYNIIRTFSTLIFPLITFMYASKILMPSGIGKIEFAKSFVLYFTLLASLGINSYGVREAACVRNKIEKLSKLVHELTLINMVTTVFTYILFFFVISNIDKLKEYNDILMLFSLNIIFCTLGFEWLFIALEEYRYITIRTIVCQIVSLLILFFFVKQSDDYLWYTLVLLISSVGANIMNIFLVKKFVVFKPLGEYNFKRHLKPLFLIFIMIMANNLYSYIDPIIIGFLAGDEEVGLYVAGLKVNRIVINILGAIGAVVMPRLALLWAQDAKDEFYKITNTIFDIILMLAIPCCIGLYFLSKEIIILFCGNLFLPAVSTMQMLIPIIIFLSLSTFLNMHILIPMNREKIVLESLVCGLVINVVLNFLLIPVYGRNGSALGTVCGELVVLMFSALYMKNNKLIDKIYCFQNLHQYLIGGILVASSCELVKFISSNNMIILILSVLLSTLAYGTLLAILKNDNFNFIYNKILAKMRRR